MSLSLAFGRRLAALHNLSPLSLTYPTAPTDIIVFVLVVVQARRIRSGYGGMNGSTILDKISRDATIYFAVIATSHLIIIVLPLAARVRLPIPVSKLDVY